MKALRNVFKKEVTFLDSDCDFKDEVRADAILKKTQQVSIEHHKTLNVSKNFYKDNNLLFLIADVSLKFNEKIPKLNKIQVTSEPFYPKRYSHRRLTEFFSGEASVAVSVDTRWVLVDTLKSRIVKNCPSELMFNSAKEEERVHNQKIIRLDNDIFIARNTANYSRCDVNNHINNAEYAGIILDSLPLELLKKATLKRMFIAYKKQVLIGESFDVFVAKDDNIYYIYGKLLNGEKCFEANAIF